MSEITKTICMLLLLCGLAGYGDDTVLAREMVAAYAESDFGRAAMLAKKMPENNHQARLILNLCKLFNRNDQNISEGQSALDDLFVDTRTPRRIRVEAGLALARTTQLMRERPDLYGKDSIAYDYGRIYRQIMEMEPSSPAARDAFCYLIRERLLDTETRDAAFAELERYIADFKGDGRLLSSVRLLAEYEYIILRGDYRSALRHLDAAFRAGIANPGLARTALFRLGYIAHTKLHDRELAERYFNEYLKKYEFSAQSVVVRRFLAEMKQEGGK